MSSLRQTLGFPKSARVRSRMDFAAVYERGVRVSDRCLSLIALTNDRASTRLGLAVSKRCGNAVQRNRLKRQLREAFRRLRTDLPANLDLVVQPHADTPLIQDDLRQSLISLTKRAAKKLSAQIRATLRDAAAADNSAFRGSR